MILSIVSAIVVFVYLHLTISRLAFIEGIANTYIPYNITFNSSGFKWQSLENQFLNQIAIPEYERISFLYTASSLETVAQIKYCIRILSPIDNTLLQRPVYITNEDKTPKQVALTFLNATDFNVVIRCLLQVPSRFTSDGPVIPWAIQDTGVVYTGCLDLD